MLIEGWSFGESLYMTFITASTVGFQEVRLLSPTGRQFVVLFIIISVMTFGYTLTTLFAYIFEGQFQTGLKERRMKRFLSLIKNHYIICGFGDVGHETAKEFQRKKVRFVVVDRQIDEQDKVRFPGAGFIQGDATEEETLEEAGIDRARGLIACLPEDPQNVFTVLTARQLRPDLLIVSQAAEERTVGKLHKAGADRVVSPKQIAGRRLAALSIRPSIVNFLDVLSTGGGDIIRIESVRIGAASGLIGKTLKETGIGERTGAIIIGILGPDGRSKSESAAMATLSSIPLQGDDELIALGNEAQVQQLLELVG